MLYQEYTRIKALPNLLLCFKGPESITCLPSQKWSDSVPNCECPPCTVGSECQHSTSFETLKRYIVDKPWTNFVVSFLFCWLIVNFGFA